MKLSFIFSLSMFIVWIFLAAVAVYVIYLIVRALKKYIKSAPVRKENAENAKTLGEILKQHRVDCKMTQELVVCEHYER